MTMRRMSSCRERRARQSREAVRSVTMTMRRMRLMSVMMRRTESVRRPRASRQTWPGVANCAKTAGDRAVCRPPAVGSDRDDDARMATTTLMMLLMTMIPMRTGMKMTRHCYVHHCRHRAMQHTRRVYWQPPRAARTVAERVATVRAAAKAHRARRSCLHRPMMIPLPMMMPTKMTRTTTAWMMQLCSASDCLVFRRHCQHPSQCRVHTRLHQGV